MRPHHGLAALLLVLTGCSAPLASDTAAPGRASAATTPHPRASGAPAATGPAFDHRDPGDSRAVLPDPISRALQTDALVLDCPEGVDRGRSLFARDWVGVHRADLDSDGREEWILNGLHPCLRQQADGHAYWWVYGGEEDAGTMQLLARALQGRVLEVLPGRHGGMADLRMHLVNGRGEPLQLDLASDGARYVPMGRLEP